MRTVPNAPVKVSLREFLALKRNVVILLAAIIAITSGEEIWMRFLPKYLQTIGAGLWVIGLFDGIKTVLGALYAYPGGVISDRWGHRRALMSFTAVSILGYALVLAIPHWGAVVGGSLLFLAWTCFSLPATFSLVAATLDRGQLSMGIGVQSVIRRIPIIIGPVIGGVLIDRFGVENGVRLGLGVTIVLSAGALCIQAKIQETTPVAAPHLDGFWKTLRRFDPALSRLLVSDILIRFCERIPFAWVVIYAMDHLGASGTQIGWLTSIEMTMSILCLIPAAHLADKHGREPFVIGTFVFFTLFPLLLIWANNFPMLAVAFAVRGLKEFGEPARKALILSYSPENARGATVGTYYLIRDLIVAFGAIVGAALWRISPQANFTTAVVIGAVATLGYCSCVRVRTSRIRVDHD